MSNKLNITIVDDHKVFRKGLRMVLEMEPTHQVAYEFESGTDFLKAISTIETDVVFMDISMPELSGFETTKRALKQNPKLKIIGMSANDDIASVNKLLSCGASGFLSKDADFDDIISAVKHIAKGNNFFSGNILVKLSQNAGTASKQKTQSEKLRSELSKRETEVLELICQGLSNHEIAERLHITDRTVEKHKSNLYLKTNTENVLNLVLFAFKNGIADISD